MTQDDIWSSVVRTQTPVFLLSRHLLDEHPYPPVPLVMTVRDRVVNTWDLIEWDKHLGYEYDAGSDSA
jgi:hypothetical protein